MYIKLYSTYKMHIFFWKFLFTQWFTFLFKSFNNFLRYSLILSVFIIQRNLDSEKLFCFDIITQISGRVILYIYIYIYIHTHIYIYEWVSSWVYCVFPYVVSKNSIRQLYSHWTTQRWMYSLAMVSKSITKKLDSQYQRQLIFFSHSDSAIFKC